MGSTGRWTESRDQITRPNRSRVSTLVCGLLLFLLATAGAASAETRTLNIDDPSDVTPTLSGVPMMLDIKNLQAQLNLDDGTFSIRTELYRAPGTIDTSENYAFYANFGFARGQGRGCDYTSLATGQHHWYSSRGNLFYDQATVSGYDGTAQLQRAMTDGGRVATVSGKLAPLAGIDIRCFEYKIGLRKFSSPSNLYSDYDTVCDCWYVRGTSDSLTPDVTDIYEYVFFDGFEPPPLIRKVDAKLRLRSKVKKKWKVEIYPKVTPRMTTVGSQPFTGKVKITVRQGWDVILSKETKPNRRTTLNLWPGKFVVTGSYRGDKWRNQSYGFESRTRFRIGS